MTLKDSQVNQKTALPICTPTEAAYSGTEYFTQHELWRRAERINSVVSDSAVPIVVPCQDNKELKTEAHRI